MEQERIKSNFINMYVSAKRINNTLTQYNLESFKNETNKINGVFLLLQIIGEAAVNIPEDVKLHHPRIPWQKLIEECGKIEAGEKMSVEQLWRLISEIIPPLVKSLAILIPSEERLVI